MTMRREQRLGLTLPIRVSGMDANGSLFEQDATTIDVTTTGARIGGIVHPLHRGCVILVQRGASKARFRVMWVGGVGQREQGQIGVQLIESGKFIWGRVIPRLFGDNYQGDRRQPAVPSPLPRYGGGPDQILK